MDEVKTIAYNPQVNAKTKPKTNRKQPVPQKEKKDRVITKTS